mmetsp:Transcript_25318/g.50758  ORF Transcript_25318/g.50758 Transcript_25318/m.50758 type:complete len:80 (+) Transcript_25318:3-242(+)
MEAFREERRELQRVEKYEHKFKQGMNMEYLKNVLVKYIETQDHEGLIPVFYSVLDFSQEEKRRLEAVRSKMSAKWTLFR